MSTPTTPKKSIGTLVEPPSGEGIVQLRIEHSALAIPSKRFVADSCEVQSNSEQVCFVFNRLSTPFSRIVVETLSVRMRHFNAATFHESFSANFRSALKAHTEAEPLQSPGSLDLRGVPNTALLAHHGIVRFNPMVGLIRFYEFTEIDETTGEVTVDPVVQVDLTPSTLSQLIAGLDNAIQQ
jgi:hypothetical protein